MPKHFLFRQYQRPQYNPILRGRFEKPRHPPVFNVQESTSHKLPQISGSKKLGFYKVVFHPLHNEAEDFFNLFLAEVCSRKAVMGPKIVIKDNVLIGAEFI